MRELKRISLEAVVVAIIGVGLALAANSLNPDGLKLGYDYFRMGRKPPTTRPPSTAPPPATQTAADPPQAANGDPYAGLSEEIKGLLQMHNIRPIRHPELKALYQDPLYQQGWYLIIDAREDAEYAAGHIPGAHQLYYYQADRYVNDVLPAIMGAEKVVIYCNGGTCDDSILVADLLKEDHFVDPGKLLVYPDGFEGWRHSGMPVECGARGSGDIVEGGR